MTCPHFMCVSGSDNLSPECIWESNCTGGQLLHSCSFYVFEERLITSVHSCLLELMNPSHICALSDCKGRSQLRTSLFIYVWLYGSDGTVHKNIVYKFKTCSKLVLLKKNSLFLFCL